MARLELVFDQERTKELVSMGFVHVTGLPTYHDFRDGFDGEIQPHKDHLGRHDYNNGKMVVVTEDGEVWLRAGRVIAQSIETICPNGTGAFVPCSNGEHIPDWFLMQRVADPFVTCDAKYSAVPKIEN